MQIVQVKTRINLDSIDFEAVRGMSDDTADTSFARDALKQSRNSW